MDSKLLAILVCPVCKSTLDYQKSGLPKLAAPTSSSAITAGLICKPCGVMYPIQDGVPVMLEDQAIALE